MQSQHLTLMQIVLKHPCYFILFILNIVLFAGPAFSLFSLQMYGCTLLSFETFSIQLLSDSFYAMNCSTSSTSPNRSNCNLYKLSLIRIILLDSVQAINMNNLLIVCLYEFCGIRQITHIVIYDSLLRKKMTIVLQISISNSFLTQIEPLIICDKAFLREWGESNILFIPITD